MKCWSMVLVMIGSALSGCATEPMKTPEQAQRGFAQGMIEADKAHEAEADRAYTASCPPGRRPLKEVRLSNGYREQRGSTCDPDLTVPIEPAHLAFDLNGVVAERVSWKSDSELCETVTKWSGYWAQLPKLERERALRRVGTRPDMMVGEELYTGDPYTVVYARFLALRHQAQMRARKLVRMDDRFLYSDLGRWPEDELSAGVDLFKCAGEEPPARVIAELEQRKAAAAEEKKCDADAACSAAKTAEQLEALRAKICIALERRRQAKANAKEELSYARETGVVNLNNLDDQKTLMILHDQQAGEWIQEYDSLAKKKFSAKTACR